MRKQKNFKAYAAILLLGSIVILLECKEAKELLLLARSHRVMSTSDWVNEINDNTGRTTRKFNCCWLSNGKLLYVRRRHEADPQAAFEFVLRDLHTGRETILSNIRPHLLTAQGWYGKQELSPDGEWLLVYGRYTGTLRTFALACSLNGSQCVDLHSKSANIVTRWYGHQGHQIVQIYKQHTSSGAIEVFRSTLCSPSHPSLVTCLPISKRQPDVFVEDTQDPKTDFTLHSSQYLLPSDRETVHRDLPFEAWLDYSLVSPDNTHFVLVLQRTRTPLFKKWLQHVLPSLSLNEEWEESLWFGSVRQAHLHEVGHIVCSSESETQDLEELHWLPNGKELGYVYKGNLYTVAAY